ncbi:hypothetical protein [Bacteroides heparinolyticus]|nr:hypothetical protein [Bacteroides heparinolyticus]
METRRGSHIIQNSGYNNIFAPGWTVASLWELFTPGRAERFLLKR